ncbi:lachesin-like [Artemia franciscana]|uniref:Ig-like domain-containing protein n=1 Tax=Artemia franciscana TaxID=6661 RepID=A0AA88IPY0_ARTSF|nr:hypothetical protein QYM36_008399 [Artemia franciscana]
MRILRVTVKNLYILPIFVLLLNANGDVSNTKVISVTANLGENLNFNCSHHDSEDSESIEDFWEREKGTSFSNGKTVLLHSVLNIEDLRREDEGTYLCYRGSVLLVMLKITVLYSPIMLPLIASSKANGSHLSIGCVAEGFPRPILHWSWEKIENSEWNLTTEEDSLHAELLLRLCSLPNNIHFLNRTDIYEETSFIISSRFTASILSFKTFPQRALANVRCTASNQFGSEQVTIYPHRDKEGTQRNGRHLEFVIAMLPPLYIAFYILFVLACKSGIEADSPLTVAKELWEISSD